ncbi:MAG: hypothetical protein JGK32_22560 [Microcoleus sp. PH2017_31_RDM_U_A]|uniref:hypothetical protein n=1 Tax=unclassified Microcoleus TaxID=2642155 RepID=UPI001D7A2050|nr:MULTISPECIES: hypothetical protein [unclassified Microcoleus]MCC3568049.1 hypothetical protein [Microcoleus sp. PH2017_31_RDM_U_A]MCC3580328.1 hypothetical protein [Microcoleus sp. PH2017_32_RDM_D_A]
MRTSFQPLLALLLSGASRLATKHQSTTLAIDFLSPAGLLMVVCEENSDVAQQVCYIS